jgi:catechol 2,3-dioxygenase
MPRGLSRAGDFASLLWSLPGFTCANLHRHSATLRLEIRRHSVHLDYEQSKGVFMSNASIGHIHLKVANLDRSIAFYRDILGFEVQQRMGNQAAFLGAGGYHHHIGLNTWESAGATPPPAGHTGLYHSAFLYPDRKALAQVLKRIVEAGLPLEGAADHGVSEAIYLRDPDDNGVEIYRDRPRADWPRDQNGGLKMVNAPLDLNALLAEAE